MRVYLGGPINGCSDEEANGWRSAVKEILATKAHTWLDPMSRDYRGRESGPEAAERIVKGDKDAIAACNMLLMNAPRPSYGTAMEIFFGYLLDKEVFVVLPKGAVPSPWIIAHASEIHYGSIVNVAEQL